jgi:acetyl esterase
MRRRAFDTLIDPAPPIAGTQDHQVTATDGTPITVRVYRPDAGDGTEALPALVYFHGGAWAFGTIDQYDGYCTSLAAGAGCVVASVNYRKAPEHPFPTGVEDCCAGLAWVHEHADELGIDGTRLSIGGNSAGGNLAAAVALVARDRGGPPLVLQILDVPGTDFTQSQPSKNPPHENVVDFYPNAEMLDHYRRLYLPAHDDWAHPYASPLLAPDLSGLPPALIITCEFDALRDEGEAYGYRLREAGVPCTMVRWLGYPHGQNMFTALTPEARHCFDLIVSALRRANASGRQEVGAAVGRERLPQ